MLSKFSFKSRITILSTSLIILTVVVLTTSFWLRIANYATSQTERQLVIAENVLTQYLLSKEQALITAASVLTADFGFKQAVATNDKKTIDSALGNHGKRIDADLMILLNTKGELLTSSTNNNGLVNELQYAIQSLPLKEVHAQLLTINASLFQMIIVPVKAPRTIAYAVIGFEFDHSVLIELKQLVSLDISLMKNGQIIESSFKNHRSIEQHLKRQLQQNTNVLLTTSDYFHHTIPFGKSDEVSAIMSISLTEIHEDFNKLVSSTIVIVLSIIIFAIGFSQIISKGLSQPLTTLLKLTKNIGNGQLDVPKLEHSLPNEFTELHQGFAVMSSAIELRENEIKYQAERDSLTGLYNRQKLLSTIAHTLNCQINILLITFNIKGFKALNDTLGVTNADIILKNIASRVQDFISTTPIEHSQHIAAARLNADEFMLSVPMPAPEEVASLVTKLHNKLEPSYWINGIKINLTLYFGVTDSLEPNLDAERLMRRSAMAVVAAYNEQLSIRYYKQGEDEAYLYTLRLINELELALEATDTPLFLTYQPKLNLKTNKVDKFEALIRWINSEGKFVNPELFVDLAEKAGLIVTLTRWVILHVVQQIAQWNEAGHCFSVSINLSAQDIQHDEFVDYLIKTLTQHKVKPSQITLELTERDIAENEAVVCARLTHLKSLGFDISVDDYGIGQSSLAKLKSLPIDELKIDKHFILTLDQCSKDQDIVASTISMGHKLGLRVVAEGVENKESLVLLTDFHCDYIQGYYLSKPITADELILWYTNHESNR